MIDEILKRIKKLKTDTLYSYGAIGGGDDRTRVYVSRLADRGVVVKVGRGRFYKPSRKFPVKRAAKRIPLDKSLFANDLFWSVRDGFEIEISTLIESYLKRYTEEDLMGLYALFGYTRLMEEALKLYKSRSNPDYRKIREILLRFEKARTGLA